LPFAPAAHLRREDAVGHALRLRRARGKEGRMSDAAKRAAAEAAVALVEDGMLVGLGTGSTMRFAIEALGRRRPRITGVPTSQATEAQARELKIALVEPDGAPLDLAIDGADE